MEKSRDLDGENRFGRRDVGSDDDLGFWGLESCSCWTNIGSNLTPIHSSSRIEIWEDESQKCLMYDFEITQ